MAMEQRNGAGGGKVAVVLGDDDDGLGTHSPRSEGRGHTLTGACRRGAAETWW